MSICRSKIYASQDAAMKPEITELYEKIQPINALKKSALAVVALKKCFMLEHKPFMIC
tara:strand:+ start:1247 stop:1420 length:174 start_codon:yes stop_codon:yes gene_type:complete